MNKLSILVIALSITLASCHAGHDHHHHDHDHDHEHEHEHEHQDGHIHEHHHHDTEGKYPTDEHVLILTGDTLHQAIDDFPLILVKFFAPWCGHCKSLAPTYRELATELAHNGQHEYAIAEVDCTQHKEACNKHSIRGYPTLKYFIDGEAHQYSGRRTKEDLANWLLSKQQEVRSASKEKVEEL